MLPLPPDPLKPRKKPKQARSEATVDAIIEATIQLLLADGERRLTTTRVAERAGVSVGTMYQYFPHKQALLYAALQSHLTHVGDAVERACHLARGSPVQKLAEVLVGAFLEAKTERLPVTQALYLIAEHLDTRTLLAGAVERNVASTAALLASAPDAEFKHLATVAFTLCSVIAGSTRIVFEQGASLAKLRLLRGELNRIGQSYLGTSSQLRFAP